MTPTLIRDEITMALKFLAMTTVPDIFLSNHSNFSSHSSSVACTFVSLNSEYKINSFLSLIPLLMQTFIHSAVLSKKKNSLSHTIEATS